MQGIILFQAQLMLARLWPLLYQVPLNRAAALSGAATLAGRRFYPPPADNTATSFRATSNPGAIDADNVASPIP